MKTPHKVYANLILLRHGESSWNLENRFTGWTNVPLTENGVKEASFAAQEIHKLPFTINFIYTSYLQRAISTAEIVSKKINFNPQNIVYDWRINERHYGNLQGLNKSETAKKFGEDKVLIWRRSYDVPPPLMNIDNVECPHFDDKFKDIPIHQIPRGESLKDVILRLKPFWKKLSSIISDNGGNFLIVGHSNSLRAIVKVLEHISDKDIIKLNLPTGVPLHYRLNRDLSIINKNFLIDDNELLKKQKSIENQGKIK